MTNKTKLTARGKRIKKDLQDEYGKKKGDRMLYDYENKHRGIKQKKGRKK